VQNLALALVPPGLEKRVAVVRRQMRRQQPYGRECDGTIHQPLQHHRMPPRRPSGLDTIVRRTLGQMKRLRAVDKHRRIALSEIRLAAVDLSQERDKVRSHSSFSGDETCRLGQQFVIR
jgi:hypothetical protein